MMVANIHPQQQTGKKHSVGCFHDVHWHNCCLKTPTGFTNIVFTTEKKKNKINSLLVVRPWARNALNILIRCVPLALLSLVCRRSLALYVWARWCDWAPATPPRSFILSSISRTKERRERHAEGRVDTKAVWQLRRNSKKKSTRTEITVWNRRGYLSSPSREGFALCFITARAARADKNTHTHTRMRI